MPIEAVPDEPEQPPQVTLDNLTAAETAMAERQAGQSITTLGNEAFPQAQLLGALGWVLYRRTDARMRFDTYMTGRTLADITRELGLSRAAVDDDDDDLGKDEPPTSPS